MHPLYGALHEPYVLVRITRGAVIAHRYIYAPPPCKALQQSRTFIPLSVSLWNDHGDPVFNGVGLAGFKSRASTFILAFLLAPFLSPTVFPFSSFILCVGVVWLGVFELTGC